MKYTGQDKISFFPAILGIVWGIIVSLTIWVIFYVLTYSIEPYRSNELLLKNITGEEYGKLYNTLSYDLNDGLNTEMHPEYKEMIATAGYLEAAGQYFLYLEDNPQKADYYEKKMNEYALDMGRFRYLREKIVKYFNK